MSGQLNQCPESFQGYGQQRYMMGTAPGNYSMMLGRNNHDGTIANNTHQYNGTLPPNQFYGQDQETTLRRIQPAGSNYHSDALSDHRSTTFILPKTTKEYEMLTKYREKWRIAINLLDVWGRQTEDQKILRFVHKIVTKTLSTTLDSSVENDEMAMFNKIFNSVKQFVCANQMPGSISGSSLVSASDRPFLDRGVNSMVGTQMLERPPSQTSQMSFYNNNTIGSRMDRHPSRLASQSQMSFLPINTNASEGRPTQETSVAAPTASRGRPSRPRGRVPQEEQQHVSQEEIDAALRALDDNMDLFSPSLTAPVRDGHVASTDTTHGRPMPGTSKANKGQAKASKPAKKTTPNSTTRNSKLNNNNIQRKEEDTPTGINAGKENNSSSRVKTTRNGRVIKSPNAYWKTNESKLNDTRANAQGTKEQSPYVDLDDSMTLRNHKIIPKGKTPPLPNSSKPLSTVAEDSNAPLPKTLQPSKKEPVGRKRKGKENVDRSETRPAKNKKSCIETVQNNPTQLALSKKNEVSKVNKSEKSNTKQIKKRSSKETVKNTQKMKKVDHVPPQNVPPLDDFDDDDDLFGRVNYRKVQTTTKALSPSDGMLSVKKVASTSLSKETPPCKTFVQLMNISTYSSLSAASTSKEAPVSKISQVTKRVKKAMEQEKTKPIKPNPNNIKTSKEIVHSSKLLSDVLRNHTAVTPLSKNMYIGTEAETDSELNDSDNEDMDNDLN